MKPARWKTENRGKLSLNEFLQSPSGFEGFGYISFTGTMAS